MLEFVVWTSNRRAGFQSTEVSHSDGVSVEKLSAGDEQV